MLIYCSRIALVAAHPSDALLSVTAEWLKAKSGETITAKMLKGDGERRLMDHSRVEWMSAIQEGAEWHAVRYAHPDRAIDGREWLTEIGVYRAAGRFLCSVLLRTEEQSASVDPNVQTTRPKLVADIFERCVVSSEASGGAPRPLRLSDAEAFLHEVNDPERTHPIIQISFAEGGRYLVDPERAASQLAGVATVAVIPPDVDTYALEEVLTERFSCYHGALNIIWPRVNASSGAIVPFNRIMSHQIEELRYRGGSPEGKLLATVCHRMNEVYARDHVAPEMVRTVKHRAALDEARRNVAKPDAEFEELTRQVDVDQKAVIAKLRADLKQRDDDLAAASSTIDELKQTKESLAFSLKNMSPRNVATAPAGLGEEARAALTAAMSEDVTLHDALKTLAILFPDRIIILDEAWKSAKDAAEFKQPRKAFDLLHRLCTGYWKALSSGKGDSDGRSIFGNAFSAKESETATSNKRAKKLRTFTYKGRPIEMMTHLRIGVKPSKAETFRAHFEWDAVDKKIVLGHCGEHLDHK